MRELSRVEINLDAVDRNIAALISVLTGERGYDPRTLSTVRRALKRGERGDRRRPVFCGTIKKDAYGLGAVQIAHRLVKAGCEMLALYGPEEAEALVEKAVTAPMLLFMPLRQLSRTDLLYRHAVAEKLHLTIHDGRQLGAVNQIGQTFGIRMPVHFYLDTGMSRGGMNDEQLGRTLRDLGDYRHVRLAGIYTHLATADSDPDFAYEQLEHFETLVEQQADQIPPGVMLHIGATCGVLRDQRFHMDLVRPGLGMFGYGQESLQGPVIAGVPTLEHAVRWVSRIVHVQRYKRRSPVGYGSTFKLRRESMLAIVPIGYGDGYPTALASKGVVRVFPNGGDQHHDVRVLGRVNMDQVVVDVTDLVNMEIDGPHPELLDSPVEIISADPEAPNSLPNLAKLARSNCYEMLCRLGRNVPRKYVSDPGRLTV